jgi:AraC-like DNA-binding protein
MPGKDRQTSLREIALACAYVDQNHLSRHFRRLTGVTPGQWWRDDR